MLLATHPLDDTALLNRARACIARLHEAHLSKYAAIPLDTPAPEAGYVVVIDQTEGDASVTASGADRARFLGNALLRPRRTPWLRASSSKPTQRPQQATAKGISATADLNDRIEFLSDPISPYTCSRARWGLYRLIRLGVRGDFCRPQTPRLWPTLLRRLGATDDAFEVQRRQRKLTRAQLFAAAMILYPRWYDPYRDTLCTLGRRSSTRSRRRPVAGVRTATDGPHQA